MTTLTVITPPAALAATPAELAAFLRISQTDDASALATLIAAAHQQVQRETGQTLITTTWQEVRDAWAPVSADGSLFLLTGPLQSVSLVETTDAVGVATSVDPAYYRPIIGSYPAEIGATTLAMRQPTARSSGLRIVYTAGLTSDPAGLPAPLKLAVLQLAAYGYQHRGEADAPVALIDRLIAPFRRVRL